MFSLIALYFAHRRLAADAAVPAAPIVAAPVPGVAANEQDSPLALPLAA